MSAQDDEFIAEALPAFVSEAYEQMETFEQLLLRLEDAPQDRELLDALFRCAHTVKGSAGMFGLDEVVAFTHHVETLLELLREGVITLDSELGTLLLQANDQARALVRRADEAGTESEAAAANRELLVARMRQACGQAQPAAPASEAAPVAAAPTGEGGGWSVQVRFGADTFRNGLDPVALLNYVRKIGTVSAVACDLAGVPALDALDAESCHLGLRFHVCTEAGREGIILPWRARLQTRGDPRHERGVTLLAVERERRVGEVETLEHLRCEREAAKEPRAETCCGARKRGDIEVPAEVGAVGETEHLGRESGVLADDVGELFDRRERVLEPHRQLGVDARGHRQVSHLAEQLAHLRLGHQLGHGERARDGLDEE